MYRNGFYALREINLSLDKGEVVAITGPSGSGKSTLMAIMGLLDRPSSGEYLYQGADVAHLPETELANIRNRKIGFVFQSFFLLPQYTVLQNVALPLWHRREPTMIAEKKSTDLLTMMGMEPYLHSKPGKLSGGQQQRVAIARALVGEPELILADEPTGSLDPQTAQEVMNMFLKLNQEYQHTLVIITHDPNISRQCGRVIFLKDGVCV